MEKKQITLRDTLGPAVFGAPEEQIGCPNWFYLAATRCRYIYCLYVRRAATESRSVFFFTSGKEND